MTIKAIHLFPHSETAVHNSCKSETPLRFKGVSYRTVNGVILLFALFRRTNHRNIFDISDTQRKQDR